jgi:hypothetical protein
MMHLCFSEPCWIVAILVLEQSLAAHPFLHSIVESWLIDDEESG